MKMLLLYTYIRAERERGNVKKRNTEYHHNIDFNFEKKRSIGSQQHINVALRTQFSYEDDATGR